MLEKTIHKLLEIQGIGLHSGAPVKISIFPQTKNGIVFRRSDLRYEPLIPAHYGSVISTRMSTTIGTSERNSVATIEHFMAALFMAGIDHALIEIDGPELPILDGSAQIFLDEIQKVGVMDLETPRKSLVIKKSVVFKNDTARVEFLPADEFEITQQIHFREPIIGIQDITIQCDQCDLGQEIAPARTFGNIADHEKLKAVGLARGATLESVLVYNDDAILSPSGLRFKDEIVRHKVLDTLGDLFTSGYRIQGHYITNKGGHFHNNEILKKIFSDPTCFEII